MKYKQRCGRLIKLDHEITLIPDTSEWNVVRDALEQFVSNMAEDDDAAIEEVTAQKLAERMAAYYAALADCEKVV